VPISVNAEGGKRAKERKGVYFGEGRSSREEKRCTLLLGKMHEKIQAKRSKLKGKKMWFSSEEDDLATIPEEARRRGELGYSVRGMALS